MSIVGAILSEDETDSASLQRVESFESLSNVWVRKYFPFESADSESEENGQGKYLNGRVTKLEPWLIDLDGSIIKGPFYVVRYDDGEEEHLSFTDLMRIVRDENGLGQPSPVRTNNRRKRDRGEQAALASLSNVDNCGSTQPSLKVRRVDNDDVLRDSGPRQEPELEAHPEPEPEAEPQVQPENTHAPESEQQPQNRTSGQRAGQLLKLRLQNFMCHENFEMDFSPHINFISGTNGSGKSAVLQGIQACLGTRARQTGRSTNLKDFVREGAHHALVAVTLSNTGEDAYKHELYGDRITVERRIGPQSSFVLRSESDRKVEQGERALKAMCEALDINAGNPVAVLTQDTARSFLAGAAKDKEKYSLYMEATLLEQIAEKQAAAEAELKEGKQSLEWKHKLLEKMRAEVEALRGKVSLLRQAADAREHQDMLSKTLAWKRVLACESDLGKLKKQMDELGPMKLRAAEENHSEALQEYTKLRQALESRTNSLHQNQSEVAANVSEIKQLKEALRSAKSRLTETEHIAEAAKRSVADAQKRVEDLVASASEDQANVVSASQAALADHNARVSEKEQQIQSLGVECQNAHETLREQQAILADHANKEDALKGEEDSVAREVRWLQQELARIRNSAHNRVQQFFPRNRVRSGMDLLDQIRQHQSDFEMPPIGPIGQYLSITDDRWAVAVEVALKNTMNKFLVHNQRDAELLRRLASACGYNDIVCVIRRLDLRRHTMDQSQLPPGGTLTVMNVVQCNNPDFETPILNYLIDAASIERVALARNYEEGRQLAYSRIRNIKSAILEDGSQMYQKGCSQAYIGAGTQSICPRLVKNLANQVAGTEERLNIKTAELDDIKQRLDELLRQREHHASKLREFEHRHRSLNKRKIKTESELDEIVRQRPDEILHQEDARSVLEAEIQEANHKVFEMQQKLLERERSVKQAKEREKAALDAVEEKRHENQQLQAKIAKEQEAMRDQSKLLNDARAKSDSFFERVKHIRKRLEEELPAIKEEVTGELQRAEQCALELCPKEEGLEAILQTKEFVWQKLGEDASQEDFEKNMEDDSLEEALEKVNREIHATERNAGGCLEDLEERLRLKDTRLRRDDSNYIRVSNLMNMFERGVALRRSSLKKLDQTTESTVQAWFKYYMEAKDHIGTIALNRNEKKLVLSVRLSDARGDQRSKPVTDLKSLSGGERSFTTVSFILALGQITDNPFRAMDEFDVFMDAVNRRISMELLIKFAYDQQHIQFLFLTPQDMSAVNDACRTCEAHHNIVIPENFIKVLRMHPARNGAQP